MLRPRIIPYLLVKNRGLVKTVQFAKPKYVGDPINAVRIFNEKEVDELIVADIDASVLNREPDYDMIKNLAAECRMPLCYSGGVNKVEQVEKIIELGVEKVAMSSAVICNPRLIAQAAEVVGNQSIVVVMDVKKSLRNERYELCTHNGNRRTGICPAEFAKKAQDLGAGEVVVNSIDQDGLMKGYDLELARQVRDAISLPLTVLGGAGSLKDIGALINRFGIIGAAAGSLFVFKGVYRAVLINYPNRSEKDGLAAGISAAPGASPGPLISNLTHMQPSMERSTLA
jgi:imidazole glycerol-phosphate synthase subunit HisF